MDVQQAGQWEIKYNIYCNTRTLNVYFVVLPISIGGVLINKEVISAGLKVLFVGSDW